ncbi:hypothetical protein [Trueperella pyogenes]|uniref:hypothetical protein n=1 Tax=Trueperella pyogenes TaxID=1661 RepID=UPI0023DE0874|nr:hypothetical protein [Trueperella pyogenes]
MFYEIPTDPRVPVWDKDGRGWEPSGDCHYVGQVGVSRETGTWADLVAKYGPLTDIKIPEVGETITVAGGNSISAEEVPENAVFINGNVVCVRVGNIFEVSRSNKIRGYLHPGEWTRLR